MGGVPSTPRWETAEHLEATFVGEKSFPVGSEYWQKLLNLPISLYWPPHRVAQACHLFAHNNCYTRHLAKILIHLVWSLQECVSTLGLPPSAYAKAVNSAYISSVFLKYLIENAKSDNFEELYLFLDESEEVPSNFQRDQNIGNQVMHSVLSFIGKVEVSSDTYLLHQELLNFMLVAMSTQLLSGPSLGPDDFHPFIYSAMVEESSVVSLVVYKLLLNYIKRPHFALKTASYEIFSEENVHSVLQRVGSAAASLMLLPLNYLVSSGNEATKSPLADSSLHLLLILIHYRKYVPDETRKDGSNDHMASDFPVERKTYFFDNPFCKALESAKNIEFDRVDIEGNAHGGQLLRLPFASLFDTLGIVTRIRPRESEFWNSLFRVFSNQLHINPQYLADEATVVLLYSLVNGNSTFLEYVLVRTDLDTLLMPMLETLYNASNRSSNQIYMVLIILLILSQDCSFNASIHKLFLPSVPWYQERLLHQTSLGSLMVIVLIRTVKYNLSKLQDVYLHTNCLATLANMAPHVHRLSAYASQRLVSLFDMLSRKYTKLAERKNGQLYIANNESREAECLPVDLSSELHLYTDFLRIVLEILNAILTYALPQNPEVVYAIMHRQEVFLPFKTHPRFNELLENIYTVLDFFNNRMDAHKIDGEWSVGKVLEVIIINCRSWHGDGMKIFNQLRFTYEQESHPEEFFIPYAWQLIISNSDFCFSPSNINLFPVDLPVEEGYEGEEEHEETASKHQNNEMYGNVVQVELSKAL